MSDTIDMVQAQYERPAQPFSNPAPSTPVRECAFSDEALLQLCEVGIRTLLDEDF